MIIDTSEQINDIQKQLEEQYLSMFTKAIDEVNVSKSKLDAIKKEIQIDQKQSRSEFMKDFPKNLMNHLMTSQRKALSILPKPKKIQDLFQNSYFIYETQNEKFEIIKKIVENVNEQIHTYFQKNIQKLRIIYNQSQMEINPIKIDDNTSNRIVIQNQNFGKNIDTLLQDFNNCLCRGTSNKLTAIFYCTYCQKHFHANCLKMNPKLKTAFVCPQCTLHNLDPLNPVFEVLVQPKLLEFSESTPQKPIQFIIPERLHGKHIEIRCIKLDGKEGLDEITWPDKGSLIFNKQQVLTFKPMTLHTSLKKRRDEKYTTHQNIKYNQKNEFIIVEDRATNQDKDDFRINPYQPCLVGVYAVNILTAQNLISKVKQNDKNYLPIEKGIEFIKNSIKQKEDTEIKVDCVIYSLQCQFDLSLIETPVRQEIVQEKYFFRSTLCTHVQCFSLENCCKLNINKQRKWRCPICKTKCFNFVIDSYWLLILKKIREAKLEISQIQFNLEGFIDSQEVQKLFDGTEHLNGIVYSKDSNDIKTSSSSNAKDCENKDLEQNKNKNQKFINNHQVKISNINMKNLNNNQKSKQRKIKRNQEVINLDDSFEGANENHETQIKKIVCLTNSQDSLQSIKGQITAPILIDD